jgi:uridylate kinase
VKTIILKISGEVFSYGAANGCSVSISDIIKQIKTLSTKCKLGIVIGGGSFFRGATDGEKLNLKPTTAHNVGMVGTIMNGLILNDLLHQEEVDSIVVSALECNTVTYPMNQQIIEKALQKQQCVIFVGGTGNPFVTTDTNAVLKALYIEADEIWKATKVDGIYDSDPKENKNAILIKEITYAKALQQKLGFMDTASLLLAENHNLVIKVFNLFEKNALKKALKDTDFGSKIYKSV